MDTVGSGHSRYCKKDEFNPARVEVDEVWGPAGKHRESPVAHSFRFLQKHVYWFFKFRWHVDIFLCKYYGHV